MNYQKENTMASWQHCRFCNGTGLDPDYDVPCSECGGQGGFGSDVVPDRTATRRDKLIGLAVLVAFILVLYFVKDPALGGP